MKNADSNKTPYQRLCDYFGTKHQGRLAAYIGCCPSRVSQVCRNNHIPDSWLLSLLKQYGLNPEWIMHGEPNPQKLKPDV